MNAPEVDLVLAWHAALNSGDVDRLLALSTEDVEVGGPRGAGRGSQLLRDWAGRAQIRLEPLRWQSSGAIVVVEQNAQWLAHDGQLTEPQIAATVFRLDDGKVSSVIRHSDFATALAAVP